MAPVPNYTRDVKKGLARWDAYLFVPDPDALAAEFASRNVEFSEPLKDTDDGLRGFEIKDTDGYVLFFGRTRSLSRMPLINHLRYRPEIDGLRAVAVVAVILFHADFRCPGGYLGVDVFFVVSGFLITSLIWSDLESGRFTFAYFWERRARRIVPALVVITIVTLVIGWFLLLPSDLENLGQASASQSIFAANFHYLQDSGYFKGVAEEKPLLHTWSLAVEEQFYLIVPFLLFGIYRSKLLRNRTAVISILTTIFAVSLGISIYGLTRFPWATFYLLPPAPGNY